MATNQKHRMIAVSSVLGEDVLLFGQMTFKEQLSQLFECQLELFLSLIHIWLQALKIAAMVHTGGWARSGHPIAFWSCKGCTVRMSTK